MGRRKQKKKRGREVSGWLTQHPQPACVDGTTHPGAHWQRVQWGDPPTPSLAEGTWVDRNPCPQWVGYPPTNKGGGGVVPPPTLLMGPMPNGRGWHGSRPTHAPFANDGAGMSPHPHAASECGWVGHAGVVGWPPTHLPLFFFCHVPS